MDWDAFATLPAAELAALVRRSGPRVCAFPINGTRRWFLLEHAGETAGDFASAYLRITWARQVELYRLLFDHGIHTLLTPIFGPDLLEREEAYRQLVEPGLAWFTRDEGMLRFYDAYDVRVRVYGDARRYLEGTPYARVLDDFDRIARRTASHGAHRLFFGVCAHDPTEAVAEIGVRYYQQHGNLPDRRAIVEAYYGEYVEPVDLFIGFDRPAAFDMPLVATGSEDLYFTVSPSPYMDVTTLRRILYDHLYARRVSEAYGEMEAADWRALAELYARNRHSVLGVGRKHKSGRFWYPLPEVNLPPELDSA